MPLIEYEKPGGEPMQLEISLPKLARKDGTP